MLGACSVVILDVLGTLLLGNFHTITSQWLREYVGALPFQKKSFSMIFLMVNSLVSMT